MKKVKSFVGQHIVCVVFTKDSSYRINVQPRFGEYEHPNITKIVPCMLDSFGDIKDLRTGEKVIPDATAQIWPAHTGTVFAYPDGRWFLMTKSYGTGCILCYELDYITEYHPETMIFREVGNRLIENA